MPIFYRSEKEKKARARLEKSQEDLRVAKLDYKSAKTDLRLEKTARKQKRVQEKFKRVHAEAHDSPSHHVGRCGAACRLGRVAHGHWR